MLLLLSSNLMVLNSKVFLVHRDVWLIKLWFEVIKRRLDFEPVSNLSYNVASLCSFVSNNVVWQGAEVDINICENIEIQLYRARCFYIQYVLHIK